MSIILNHVSHVYGAGTNQAVKALDDVSLKIEDGEFNADSAYECSFETHRGRNLFQRSGYP